MYSFAVDLSLCSDIEENYLNDFELVKSFYLDNLENLSTFSEDSNLQFKLNLKFEMEIEPNLKEIIEELKFNDLLVNSYTASLPYWIKFELDLKKKILKISYFIFWMKKKIIELQSFQSIISSKIVEIQESLFFSISEEFKTYIQAPDKKFFLNWLSAMKEETVIQTGVSIEQIIYGSSSSIRKEEIGADEDLFYDNDNNLNLLKSRSEKIIEKVNKSSSKLKYTQNKQENNSDYIEFLNRGGIVGDIITDRGSTFQAHIIKINVIKEIEEYLKFLKSNNKISKATHNIMAYRIAGTTSKKISKDSDSSSSNITEGFDDDGEDSAGIRLLGILQKMKIVNVMVVVSRWFGGIMLGQDRFKHINDACKNLILLYKNKFDFINY